MTDAIAYDEPIPDLLCESPALRVDLDELHEALVFGFTLGTSSEAFDRVLATASLPPSTWDPTAFERDIFLEDLARRALRIRIAGKHVQPCLPYLLRVISEPPRELGIVTMRQRVFAELQTSPQLRQDFERIYVRLAELKSALASEGSARRSVATHRRMEILRTIQEIILDLSTSFVGSTSALKRLPAFARATKESEGYKRLETLLEHDSHLGTVNLEVRVGADGTLRKFDIVKVRENQENPHYVSPFMRFWNRIGLLFRGFRLTAGEIFERLIDDVFSGMERPVAFLVQLLGDMEFYLAGLGLADMAKDKGLPVCLPEIVPDSIAGMNVVRLYNPLLLAGKSKPVPCNLSTKRKDAVVMVTGPNSGGKTRLLQSIGLVQLLGQTGCFVTAESATLPMLGGMFVSLIEEAKSDQPEGQLGMELMRIRRLFEELGFSSLVLLDELCSGTNPSEGEEIARLVISLLPDLESPVFLTTHLLTLASHLSEEPPVPTLEFLQVQLDENDRATYAFVPGVARTSLAHKTAARLGVTRDELVTLIAKKKRADALGEERPVKQRVAAVPERVSAAPRRLQRPARLR
ncbi:MAG: DNA mismatch repair protein [Polyangiaceae bacterium]|nr:DNA mismatch repair protein [Polyangiaceae bacterium]